MEALTLFLLGVGPPGPLGRFRVRHHGLRRLGWGPLGEPQQQRWMEPSRLLQGIRGWLRIQRATLLVHKTVIHPPIIRLSPELHAEPVEAVMVGRSWSRFKDLSDHAECEIRQLPIPTPECLRVEYLHLLDFCIGKEWELLPSSSL